jgi:NitT/TauT family transport system permease protein
MSATADALTDAEAALPPTAGNPDLTPAPILAPEAEVTRRGRISPSTRHKLIILGCQIALLAFVLAFWEWAAAPKGEGLIDEYYVSQPSAIMEQLGKFIDQGVLWSSILVTMRTTLIGFAIGAGLGLLAGFFVGIHENVSSVLQPFVSALYSIPRLALVPLFILWFGIGQTSQIALVASVVFFLVFYATFAGVRDVDHELIDKMRLMRASRWSVHTKATLPSAYVFIISGLSISGPYALVVAVTAEMLSSNEGMGYLLQRSSGQFNTNGVFASIFVMMIMGIVLMGAIRLLEHRLLRWKPRRPSLES